MRRVAHGPCANPEGDGDRGNRARLLEDDRHAARQHGPRGVESAGHTSAFEGSKEPTVRLEGFSTDRATLDTSSSVTAAIRDGRSRKPSTFAIVSKYPSWWAISVMLSLSKTSRALSCAL